MSTPSTLTASHPPNPLCHHAHMPGCQSSTSGYRQGAPLANARSKLAYDNYISPHSPADSHHSGRTQSKKPHYASINDKNPSPTMQSEREPRRANWHDFYRNGVPKEVIVIDDSSPEASSKTHRASDVQKRSTQHADKRRKTDASTVYDPIYPHRSKNRPPQHDESKSNSTASSGRTTSALYPSTAPTSMTSQSSNGHKVQRLDDARVGQKRKRPARHAADGATPELELITQNYSWSNYVPPPRPPVKASEVYVEVVRDVRAHSTALWQLWLTPPQKTSSSGQKIDDDDGHYIVNPDSDLTDRCKFSPVAEPLQGEKILTEWKQIRLSNFLVKGLSARW